jgi:hypothetical protein
MRNIWPVLRLIIFWIIGHGIILVLADRGIYPDRWFASLIGSTVSSISAAWIVTGIFALALSLVWELIIHDRLANLSRKTPIAPISNNVISVTPTPPHITTPTPERASNSNPLFDEIRNFYKDRTTAEGDRQFGQYKGQLTRVAGTVKELSLLPQYRSGSLYLEDDFLTSIRLTFEKEQYDNFSALRKGDKVTATGLFENAGQFRIELKECKILSYS